jgi:hypothetical protein
MRQPRSIVLPQSTIPRADSFRCFYADALILRASRVLLGRPALLARPVACHLSLWLVEQARALSRGRWACATHATRKRYKVYRL